MPWGVQVIRVQLLYSGNLELGQFVRNIWLSAAHIPGSSNVDADQLSRDLKLDLEWMLSAHVFKRTIALFGQPDIDLFASRLNVQVETYVSWKPHPKAKSVDAFTVDWSQFFFSAFPPFCFISRCVQEIIQDRATGILIIPKWTTQPYFTVVLGLLTDTPRVLRASAQNLVHPTLTGPHPLHHRLELLDANYQAILAIVRVFARHCRDYHAFLER